MVQEVHGSSRVPSEFEHCFQRQHDHYQVGRQLKSISGKRIHHFNIRLFRVTNLISWKEVAINHCPDGKILADYFSKPLIRKLFFMIRSDIMNFASRK